jgi:hypothetical protein
MFLFLAEPTVVTPWFKLQKPKKNTKNQITSQVASEEVIGIKLMKTKLQTQNLKN